MRWLVKLFYYGRLKRLERIGKAAALLAAGRTTEAERLLESARPRRWVEDMAVYHYVMGKLRMEEGSLEDAERHLQTALGLGLERPSVKLNLAVLKVRRCDLSAALALLTDVELSDDEDILDEARLMRQVISKVTRGSLHSGIALRAARFRKKFLSTRADGGEDKSAEAREATLFALSAALISEKLSTKDREDGILLYGTLLVEHLGGHWLLGLEPRDHRVLYKGIALHPALGVERLLSGTIDGLSFDGVL